MKTTRGVNRRSFMAKVLGGVAAGGAFTLVGGGEAGAFQCSDMDSGPNADQRYAGRSCQQIPCTDHDEGMNSDGRRGRHCHQYHGCSDRDPIATGDAVGYGRNCT
jgi:hypothetical protein